MRSAFGQMRRFAKCAVQQQQRQEIMVSDVKHKKGAGGKNQKGKRTKENNT